jgi:hypothetical protein
MAGHPDSPARPPATDDCGVINPNRQQGWRLGHGAPAVLAGLLLIFALSGCACRPGYVGPYGGIHPARCVVW